MSWERETIVKRAFRGVCPRGDVSLGVPLNGRVF